MCIGRKMYKEQRMNIKFCVKNGKSATETLQMLQIAYGDDCLSRTQVFEWHRRFKEGREDVNDDEHPGRPCDAITEENIEKVRDFVKVCKTSSVRFMEMELGIAKTTIHRILTEKIGLRKLNSKFVPHRLTDDQKLYRIEHCKDIIKLARRDENFVKSIVTGDETWCFQYEPETKRQSAEWRSPDEGNPKKSRFMKSKIKTMLISFYDSKGIIHKEFVPNGSTVNADYYLGVMKRLLSRIRRVRPEYREPGSWRLLHDNAPAHRASQITDFLTKNQIFLLEHSPYSPDLAPCDYFLFPILHLAMKGKRYATIEVIKQSTTTILNNIPVNDIKHSFDALVERAKQCISVDGDYFE